MTDKEPMTFDEYIERFIKPQAEAGVRPYVVMMEAYRLAKEGKMTPELARAFAREAFP